MDTTERYADEIAATIASGERTSATARASWAAPPLARVLPPLLSLLAGALAWEAAGRILQFSFVPPLSRVLAASGTLIANGQILGPLAASLRNLVVGYALACIAGVGLGVLMARYRLLGDVLDPYISALLAAPKIIFVPVLFAFFGVRREVAVAVIFLSAVFVIIINTISAVRSVDDRYIEMARSFGARKRDLFWKVLIPGAMPLTMAGLRLGMGRAVKGMINAEMMIAVFGLGYLLRTYGGRFDAEKVFAVLLVVVTVALLLTTAVGVVERRATRWVDS